MFGVLNHCVLDTQAYVAEWLFYDIGPRIWNETRAANDHADVRVIVRPDKDRGLTLSGWQTTLSAAQCDSLAGTEHCFRVLIHDSAEENLADRFPLAVGKVSQDADIVGSECDAARSGVADGGAEASWTSLRERDGEVILAVRNDLWGEVQTVTSLNRREYASRGVARAADKAHGCEYEDC